MRDQMNSVHIVNTIPPIAARTDNTAITSTIIDTLGYGSLTFALLIGTNTDADATFTVSMEEGTESNLSGSNAVAAADLVGTTTLASYQFDDDTEARKIGYIGSKRYVRLTITPANNAAGNIFISGAAILGNPGRQPTSNPPA